MNSGEIMVVCIVAIVMITSIIKSRAKFHRDGEGDKLGGAADVENARLRDEIKQLQERLKVLERITVEKENTLSREIEQLRDRS